MGFESYLYVKHLDSLVKEGKVDEALINDAVKRILKVKFELGLFDDPYKYCDSVREKEVIGSKENHATVLEMAKKSIVLLKNENNLLPLKKNGQNIALIGPLSNDKNSPLGSWRIAGDDNTAVSVLEGMQEYKDNNLMHAKGADLVKGNQAFIFETEINETDTSGFQAAIKTAKKADVVIMVLGEHGFQTGEGRSKVNLDLPGVQQALLEEVYKVNKNIVLVLMNGRPLTINWAAEKIPTILEAWHLGTQSGNAIAQVLYGDYNPSGKLPMTFPRNVGQIPIYYNFKNTGRPTNPGQNLVFWSHFGDVENTPLYPFGHGLSYTTFKYENLKLSANTLNETGEIKATFNLTNTGSYDGKEVAQFYIRDLFASTTRPVKELKGFEMVHLKAGETKEVTFTINKETLKFYTANNIWETEPGDFKLFIGGSSYTNLEGAFNYDEN